MRNVCFKLCGLLLLVMLAMPIAASAADANSVSTENAVATLYSDLDAIAPGQNFWLALELQPREGWHTYWRNPGDSGLPTTINWTLPEGFEAGDIRWPAPEAVPYGPLMNFGAHLERTLGRVLDCSSAVSGGSAKAPEERYPSRQFDVYSLEPRCGLFRA